MSASLPVVTGGVLTYMMGSGVDGGAARLPPAPAAEQHFAARCGP